MGAHHQPAAVRHGRHASWASATMIGVLTVSSWTRQAEAGIHIDLIEARVGFVDLIEPDNFNFFEVFDIPNPFVGAFVQGTGYQPYVLTVSTLTTFESNGGVYDGDYAYFTFDNEIAGPAWSHPNPSIAAARSLIGFTADTDVVVTVTGIVTGTADGRGFIDSDPFPPGDIVIAPGSDPVTYSFTLAAGSHQIVMGGVIYDLTGGSAGFSGSVTITAVPAPAVAASLAMLGFAGRRRRR